MRQATKTSLMTLHCNYPPRYRVCRLLASPVHYSTLRAQVRQSRQLLPGAPRHSPALHSTQGIRTIPPLRVVDSRCPEQQTVRRFRSVRPAPLRAITGDGVPRTMSFPRLRIFLRPALAAALLSSALAGVVGPVSPVGPLCAGLVATASIATVSVATVFTASRARAHSIGRFDRYGCHADRRLGEYHCHRGRFSGQSFPSRTVLNEAALNEAANNPPTETGTAPPDSSGGIFGRAAEALFGAEPTEVPAAAPIEAPTAAPLHMPDGESTPPTTKQAAGVPATAPPGFGNASPRPDAAAASPPTQTGPDTARERPAAPHASGDFAKRLRTLRELRELGLITQEEFGQRRQAILDEI